VRGLRWIHCSTSPCLPPRGKGPVPATALVTLNITERAVQALAELSKYELLVDVPRPDDFIAFAKRGLFAYDWSDVHRAAENRLNSYELLARPMRPVTLAELPAAVWNLAAPTRIVEIAFGALHVPLDCIAV
jgi:hypothetical protein